MARPWESALHFEPTPGLNLLPKYRAKSARWCQVVPLLRFPVPCLPLLRLPVGLVAALVLPGSVGPVLPLRFVRVQLVLLLFRVSFYYRCRFPRSRLVGWLLTLPLPGRLLATAPLPSRRWLATAPPDLSGLVTLLRVLPIGVVRCWLVVPQPVALHHLL